MAAKKGLGQKGRVPVGSPDPQHPSPPWKGAHEFTVLQVPDEGPQDEADFLAFYNGNVPEDIRRRNEDLLQGGF